MENILFTIQKVYCINTTLQNSTLEKFNTGIANQNNNDHVISFDGKQMAISNHVGEKRISTLLYFRLQVQINRYKSLLRIQVIPICIAGQPMERN